MKIEDMQKIWDASSNQTLYVMDEKAVEKSVKQKVLSANRKADFIEYFIIGMNVVVVAILFLIGWANNRLDFTEYSMGIFMLISVVAVLKYRKKRLANSDRWDQSMLGSLDEAIHHATYRAKMTNAFLTWYILGVGLLSILHLWMEDINIWIIMGMSMVFVVGYLAGRWEQKAWHEKQRDDLISLRKTLTSD